PTRETPLIERGFLLPEIQRVVVLGPALIIVPLCRDCFSTARLVLLNTRYLDVYLLIFKSHRTLQPLDLTACNA
ncbi:TPA: hypothetical protein ACSP23_004364, partial [Aeromonas hydrophila]